MGYAQTVAVDGGSGGFRLAAPRAGERPRSLRPGGVRPEAE